MNIPLGAGVPTILHCELPAHLKDYAENYRIICEDDLKSSKTPMAVKKMLYDLVDERASGIICDLGCGDGYIIQRIESHTKIAVDIALPYLENLSPDILRIYGSVDDVPLEDNSVNTIICTDVLEHVLSAESLAKEIDRLLTPGGDLLMAFPYEQDLSVYDLPEYKSQCKQYKQVHLRSIDDDMIDALFPKFYIWSSEMITVGMAEMKFKPYPIKFIHMTRKSNAR